MKKGDLKTKNILIQTVDKEEPKFENKYFSPFKKKGGKKAKCNNMGLLYLSAAARVSQQWL